MMVQFWLKITVITINPFFLDLVTSHIIYLWIILAHLSRYGSGVFLHLSYLASLAVKPTRCLLLQKVRGCSVVTVEAFHPYSLKWLCAIYTEPPADNLTTSAERWLILFSLICWAVSKMFWIKVLVTLNAIKSILSKSVGFLNRGLLFAGCCDLWNL